ncbi:MAG: hypothetical protein QM739_06330 [Propionivibrio sp.]
MTLWLADAAACTICSNRCCRLVCDWRYTWYAMNSEMGSAATSMTMKR